MGSELQVFGGGWGLAFLSLVCWSCMGRGGEGFFFPGAIALVDTQIELFFEHNVLAVVLERVRLNADGYSNVAKRSFAFCF